MCTPKRVGNAYHGRVSAPRRFAWRWADRILVFHGGKLERDASSGEVFQDQALLDRCGLEQPLLWQVARILNVPAPHNPEEFAAYQLGGK